MYDKIIESLATLDIDMYEHVYDEYKSLVVLTDYLIEHLVDRTWWTNYE